MNPCYNKLIKVEFIKDKRENMSNKLVKTSKKSEKITKKQKKFLFFVSLLILTIAFIFVWSRVYLNERTFKERMENMVLGVDYFIEDVPIISKKVETDVNEPIYENYYFYYRHGNEYEYQNRMQVPKSIYFEYEAGDTISAYTIDHYNYSYKKEGILPKNQFVNNEIMKGIGVLLGVGIAVLMIFFKLTN